MSDEKRKILVNVMIAVFIGSAIFLGVFSVFLLSSADGSIVASAPVVNTIEKPEVTPTSLPATLPAENEEIDLDGQSPDDIQIGSVVQIFNTEGAGLRLRSNPGTSSSVQFIGEELEPFSVINGPVEQDGFVWWYLESPYDANRGGWAAATYLQLIEETD